MRYIASTADFITTFDRAIAKGQDNEGFGFHREVGIELHLHGRSPVRFHHTAAGALASYIARNYAAIFREHLLVLDHMTGSTGNALVWPVLALKNAPW